jgi:hypothetical protein
MKRDDNQYNDPRWQRKRLEVFSFYGWQCCFCDRDIDQVSKNGGQFHAHHRYYVKGRDIWEYLVTDFLCLCDECHEQTHIALDEIRRLLSPLHYVDINLFADSLLKAFERQTPRTVLLSMRMFLEDPERVAQIYDDGGFKRDWTIQHVEPKP